MAENIRDKSLRAFFGAARKRRSNLNPLSLDRLALFLGLFLLAFLGALALFPGFFAPYDPSDLVGRPLLPPSPEFRLGTNDIGQDLLSELIWGTRISLSVGLAVGIFSVGAGALAGIFAGYVGGWRGGVLMRLVDLTLALPFLPLVILLSAYLGPGQRNVILILALVSWAGPARLVRARVLAVKNAPYYEGARAIGGSPAWIMRTYVWPGVRNIAIVQAVLVAGISILAEASLSFLGLGDTTAKSWGTMLYFARASGAFLGESWKWWVMPAGIMISLSVLSLVLIGFGLEGRLRREMGR